MKAACYFCLALFALICSDAGSAQQDRDDSVPRTYFGLHIHRADQGTVWPTVQFGSWRLWDAYVGWAQLEPAKGKWDFSRLDRYVAMASAENVDILLPLAMTPRWASARPDEISPYQPGNVAEPKNISDWTAYVSAVASRYKGRIKHYEVWNEPSDINHYSGNLEKLVQLTCEANRILKAIDPGIKVISPASAGGGRHIDYLNMFLAAGGNRCIDIVGHHFYVFRESPEAMVPLIRKVKRVMKANNVGHLPLWNTETGYWIENGDGTPDHPMVAKGGWRRLGLERESADYLIRALLIARAEGVGRFYWYSWDSRYGLGMIEPSSEKEKPITKAWRSLAGRLIGATELACKESWDRWVCTFVLKSGRKDRVSWEK